MKQIIVTCSLFFLLHFNTLGQHRFLIGFNAGLGLASWKEKATQSGTANYDPVLNDKKTSGSAIAVNASAQYCFSRFATGLSYKYYEFTFSSNPTLLLRSFPTQMSSLGIKTNYNIRLSKKIQLSPSVDFGVFWLSGDLNNIVSQKIYVSPSFELRKDFGKIIIMTGFDVNILSFKYPDYQTLPNYVVKTSALISSVNIKGGLILKIL